MEQLICHRYLPFQSTDAAALLRGFLARRVLIGMARKDLTA